MTTSTVAGTRPALPLADACCAPLLREPITASQAAELSRLLKALADPTRLSMATTLRRHGEPVCICDLVAVFGLSQPTISHHMAVLKGAGLVTVEKRGLWGFYSLNPDLPAATGRILDALLESA